jgi:hypothetical protein
MATDDARQAAEAVEFR